MGLPGILSSGHLPNLAVQCQEVSRLGNLHFSMNVKQLTKDLCGDRGPFGNPEVLLSEEGSRLFRVLVEVNPHENWEEKLISGSLARERVGITTGNFERYDNSETESLTERIKSFVNSMRNKFPQEAPKILTLSVCILACLKYKSPLPPEFWRGTIFPIDDET